MVGHGTLEAAKTVLEVADVAWTAVESYHHHHEHEEHHHKAADVKDEGGDDDDDELKALRSENKRLRNLLEQNLKLLQNLSESPCLLEDCPPDLHARLMETVESPKFLTKVESLREKLADGKFPFKEASGTDLQSAEELINLDLEEPNWWVWVSDPICPSNVEERSGIDDENYVVVSEEHVVDGVANFMARCILSNPKAQNLTPQEMQKTLSKALGGMNNLEKMVNVWHAGMIFWTLSTWGFAFAGFYQTRAVMRLAAMGAHTTSKAVLMAL